MTDAASIKHLLNRSDRKHAIPLFDAIIDRANIDKPYAKFFNAWLTFGNTVILRDELCSPFKKTVFITTQTNLKYPFFENWTAIDSARLEEFDIQISEQSAS